MLRESESLLRDAVQRQARILGEHDYDTLTTILELAELLHTSARYDEASEYYQKHFSDYIEVYGIDHKSTIESLDALLKNYEAEGRRPGADDLVLEYLEKLRQLKGEDELNLLRVQKMVADVAGRLQEVTYDKSNTETGSSHGRQADPVPEAFLKDHILLLRPGSPPWQAVWSCWDTIGPRALRVKNLEAVAKAESIQ
ncbi:hypothetical protein BJ878DRAFT_527896 [Calycina marina]|uniref:Uncharacterized protein n=1 Tax=Calycina marina TaxID=1763456 RepID=A0A9P7YUX5_9HELO|nr:hypothetical protein BJ878DRAFT_527896 [Calycina marina]